MDPQALDSNVKRIARDGGVCASALSGRAARTRPPGVLAALIAALVPAVLSAASGIRVVTYNIDCSDQSIVAPNTGFDTVIQAIGNHHLAGNAQPVDVLVMQELDGIQAAPQGNSATLPYVVSELNAIYGAGTYALDPTADPTSGPFTGNGPSGLVYNTHTIQVVSATPIGAAPSSSGAPRQPIRYKLHPVGYASTNDFYIYVSHYKASTGSTNMNRRNIEATEIRADADGLGTGVHIIYSGDFNLTGASSEPAYQTLIGAGNGQAHDPVNPANNWTNTSTFVGLCSESATTLDARFDFLLVTGAVLNQPGLQLVSGSYTAFGNNGSTPFGTAVNGTNTDLADLPNRTQVLNLLTTVSDHLPVVADFTIVGSAPPPPTNVSASPNPVCGGTGTTLSATVPAGQTVDWFTGSCGGTAVGTGTSLLVSPAVGTTYYARARVTATGDVSTTCGSVAVSVSQPASITLQPAAQTVCSNGTVNFIVAAGGTGPLTYQWRKGTTNLTNDGHFSGVTTSMLSIAVPVDSDDGSYNCVVSNSCAGATSDSALLTVCVADFNCDGFVTGDDFDAFAAAFDAGDISADVNHDGFTNGDDFDAFSRAFDAGC